MKQRGLTLKQENFCLAYISNGGNAAAAYRSSYNAERMTTPIIARKAHEITENPKIKARLKELRAPLVEKAQITLGKHLDDLLDIRDQAIAAGNFGAAVAAEVARGKASGLYVERSESTVNVTIGMADRIKQARERVINGVREKALIEHEPIH